MSNDKKIILITGISRGLGHGIAQAALNRGDYVLGLGRKSATDLESNPDFHFAQADVTNGSECATALKTLLNGRTQLDCVILNAGTLGPIADMREQSLEAIKDVMEVNVWANKTLLDMLLAQNLPIKQIVAISSGASVNGNRGWGGYSISKAALNMVVKLYAHEREDIHFTALAPGLVDTGMQEQIRDLPDDVPFPSVARLKKACGTEAMPDSASAGRNILEAVERLPDLFKSGTFADIRKPPLAK